MNMLPWIKRVRFQFTEMSKDTAVDQRPASVRTKDNAWPVTYATVRLTRSLRLWFVPFPSFIFASPIEPVGVTELSVCVELLSEMLSAKFDIDRLEEADQLERLKDFARIAPLYNLDPELYGGDLIGHTTILAWEIILMRRHNRRVDLRPTPVFVAPLH